MTSSVIDPAAATDDAAFATALAEGAGEVLRALRARADAGEFADLDALREAGDAEAQTWLAAELARIRPGDAVLSEEAADDPRRLDAERVWIVDPLDGTREFAERTADGGWREDFAVHVALWQRDAGLTAGAVGLPARGTVHRTGTGAAPADRRAATERAPGTDGPLRVAVSRTRPPAIATALAETGAVELVPLGSAGYKTAAVLEGMVDAYVHAGGQYEWDTAAPVAVALDAGLVATRLDGSALAFNRPRPWCPDLIICRPEVADRLRAAIDAQVAASHDPVREPS